MLGETPWVYVSMNLCAWMFKFGNINTRTNLKPFSTTCSTFLPLNLQRSVEGGKNQIFQKS